jgi:uncharacterized cupin superfamily protein
LYSIKCKFGAFHYEFDELEECEVLAGVADLVEVIQAVVRVSLIHLSCSEFVLNDL